MAHDRTQDVTNPGRNDPDDAQFVVLSQISSVRLQDDVDHPLVIVRTQTEDISMSFTTLAAAQAKYAALRSAIEAL